ncbi:hypothetical protein ACRRTK_006386 [Alexandromys fortis]
MLQPKPSEQEGVSMKAGQEPAPQPGTDVVPAAPRKPRKCSKLVLLTASKDSDKVATAKRKGVHCIMSLGVPGPATLAKALLKTHPEAQRAIEAAPQEPEQKRSKLDLVSPALGASLSPNLVPTSTGAEDGSVTETVYTEEWSLAGIPRFPQDWDADGPEDSGESEVSSSSPEGSPVFPEAPSPSP